MPAGKTYISILFIIIFGLYSETWNNILSTSKPTIVIQLIRVAKEDALRVRRLYLKEPKPGPGGRPEEFPEEGNVEAKYVRWVALGTWGSNEKMPQIKENVSGKAQQRWETSWAVWEIVVQHCWRVGYEWSVGSNEAGAWEWLLWGRRKDVVAWCSNQRHPPNMEPLTTEHPTMEMSTIEPPTMKSSAMGPSTMESLTTEPSMSLAALGEEGAWSQR